MKKLIKEPGQYRQSIIFQKLKKHFIFLCNLVAVLKNITAYL